MATVTPCARCGKFAPDAVVKSPFDFQFICLDCDKVERGHPDYQRAAIAAFCAIQRRDQSFRGTGIPAELQRIFGNSKQAPWIPKQPHFDRSKNGANSDKNAVTER
jgi:hypothetical protein